MKCYLCATTNGPGGVCYHIATAIGVCLECGIGICRQHGVKGAHASSPLRCQDCADYSSRSATSEGRPLVTQAS